MKKTIKSFADSLTFTPLFPERTAKRASGDFDVLFQIWSNRKAMARSIRMQESGDTKNRWIPCMPLSAGEE
jgi:hypothetical protein